MIDRPTKIWFLCWPDGKMFEGTQTSVSKQHAIEKALSGWLIPQWFPGLNWGHMGYGVVGELWKSMEKAGFKCHEIDTEVTGVSY